MQPISLDTNPRQPTTPVLEEQLASLAVHSFTSLKRDEPITRRGAIRLRRSGRIIAAVLALVSAAAVHASIGRRTGSDRSPSTRRT